MQEFNFRPTGTANYIQIRLSEEVLIPLYRFLHFQEHRKRWCGCTNKNCFSEKILRFSLGCGSLFAYSLHPTVAPCRFGVTRQPKRYHFKYKSIVSSSLNLLITTFSSNLSPIFSSLALQLTSVAVPLLCRSALSPIATIPPCR